MFLCQEDQQFAKNLWKSLQRDLASAQARYLFNYVNTACC